MRPTRKAILFATMAAISAVLVVVTTSFAAGAAAAPDPRVAAAEVNVAAYCTALVDDATTTRQRNTRADLCTMWTRELADLTPTTPPTTTAPPTTTSAPTTRPPVTTTPPVTTPAPTTTPPPAAAYPDASNTGVPSGVVLQPYTGPCVITSPNSAIIGRTVNCSPLTIRAANVVINQSRINGAVLPESGSLGIVDSEIIAPAGQTGLDGSNYTATRVDITGGNRHGNCWTACTVRDSWLHGNRLDPASQHAAGFRLGQYTTLEHNTLTCDAPQNSAGGGCSAPITGYPDFAPLHHNTVVGNWIPASPNSAFCAYGGATAGKDYSNDPTNATYIVFRDNVFGRGANGKCAIYGPIGDYDDSRTGNVWANNRFDNGTAIGV